MPAQAYGDRLRDAGMEAGEAARKVPLFDKVLAAGPGRSPHAAWFVPGRLELFGTHTDYAGGRSLVAAIPRGFAVAMWPRADGRVHAIDGLTGDNVLVDPRQPPGRFRGWRHYVEVAAARLERNFPGAAMGADVVFGSDLPRAAGMSSSSALVVGLGTALIEAGGLRRRSEWNRQIRTAVDEAGYLACIENGRTFGDLAGDAGVGTHGGSEDHAAMLAGVPGACRVFAFVPMRIIETAPVPDRWTIVIAASGVGSHKTGTEREAYNRLSQGAAALLEIWNGHFEPAPSLSVALESRGGAVDRLSALVAQTTTPGWTPAQLVRRLQHFVREDRRVEIAASALRQGDEGALGAAALESQQDGETLLGNQVPATSALTRLAVESGAFAARSFGAGFGGSVWAAVTGDASTFLDRWLTAYRVEVPVPGAHATGFVANPGPPLTKVG
jgi:galactokinase